MATIVAGALIVYGRLLYLIWVCRSPKDAAELLLAYDFPAILAAACIFAVCICCRAGLAFWRGRRRRRRLRELRRFRARYCEYGTEWQKFLASETAWENFVLGITPMSVSGSEEIPCISPQPVWALFGVQLALIWLLAVPLHIPAAMPEWIRASPEQTGTVRPA